MVSAKQQGEVSEVMAVLDDYGFTQRQNDPSSVVRKAERACVFTPIYRARGFAEKRPIHQNPSFAN
jgi:hypothetical protein